MREKTLRKFIDNAVSVVAVAYPMTAVPQAIKIFAEKNAQGLSFLAWLGFLLFELVLVAYGVSHKLKPIIITGVLWTILYITILVGILKYG